MLDGSTGGDHFKIQQTQDTSSTSSWTASKQYLAQLPSRNCSYKSQRDSRAWSLKVSKCLKQQWSSSKCSNRKNEIVFLVVQRRINMPRILIYADHHRANPGRVAQVKGTEMYKTRNPNIETLADKAIPTTTKADKLVSPGWRREYWYCDRNRGKWWQRWRGSNQGHHANDHKGQHQINQQHSRNQPQGRRNHSGHPHMTHSGGFENASPTYLLCINPLQVQTSKKTLRYKIQGDSRANCSIATDRDELSWQIKHSITPHWKLKPSMEKATKQENIEQLKKQSEQE